MKNVLAMFLAVLMLLSMTACSGSEEPPRGTITDGSSADGSADVSNGNSVDTSDDSSTDETETFAFGKTTGGKYENAFIGLGCNLDSNWTFKSDEEIRQTNNLTMDLLGDDLADAIDSASIIYDMAATHSNGLDNLNINLEKHTALQVASLDLKSMMESTQDMMKSAFEGMGYTNIQFTITEVTIDGEAFTAMKTTGEINGISMYLYTVPIKCGKYIANLSLGTFKEDRTKELLDCFYLVD